jgi:preprotein translocase subunit SecB
METHPLRLSPLQLEGYYIEEIAISAMPHVLESTGLELWGNFHPSIKELDRTTPFAFFADVDNAYKEDEPRRRRIKLTVESQNDESPNLPYKFRIVLVGYFEVDETYPADKVELLIGVNGPSLLYSAAREALATATGRGPFPAIVLPSVSFMPPTELQPQQTKPKPKKLKGAKRSVKRAVKQK